MTRFWITLDEAVDFVFSCFFRMVGGEIFIIKIQSIKIISFDKTMDHQNKHKIIGNKTVNKINKKIISET